MRWGKGKYSWRERYDLIDAYYDNDRVVSGKIYDRTKREVVQEVREHNLR